MMQWISSWWWPQEQTTVVDVPPAQVEVVEPELEVLPFQEDIDGLNIMVVGKRGCGKSLLIKSLVPDARSVEAYDVSSYGMARQWVGMPGVARKFAVDLAGKPGQALLTVLMNSRVQKISFAFAALSLNILPPAARANIDMFFAFQPEAYMLSQLGCSETQLNSAFAKLQPYECLCWKNGEKTLYRCRATWPSTQ